VGSVVQHVCPGFCASALPGVWRTVRHVNAFLPMCPSYWGMGIPGQHADVAICVRNVWHPCRRACTRTSCLQEAAAADRHNGACCTHFVYHLPRYVQHAEMSHQGTDILSHSYRKRFPAKRRKHREPAPGYACRKHGSWSQGFAGQADAAFGHVMAPASCQMCRLVTVSGVACRACHPEDDCV